MMYPTNIPRFRRRKSTPQHGFNRDVPIETNLGQWRMMPEHEDKQGGFITEYERAGVIRTEYQSPQIHNWIVVSFKNTAQNSLPSKSSASSANKPLVDMVGWLSQTSVAVRNIVMIALLLVVFRLAYIYLGVDSCNFINSRAVVINGSPAIVPQLQDIANSYQHTCWGARVSINSDILLHGGTSQSKGLPQGSLPSLDQLEQGKIDIATSDLFANSLQQPDLQDHQIAIVVYALVVNAQVDVTNLSAEDIQGIYSGNITNWQQIDHHSNKRIVVISQDANSGPSVIFDTYILKGQNQIPPNIEVPETTPGNTIVDIVNKVQNNDGAISYVPLYYANKYHLNIISIDGNDPRNSILVKQGRYTFWNIEHMYTKASPNFVAAFFQHNLTDDFILHMYSETAMHVLDNNGYLTPNEFPLSVLKQHALI